MSFSRTTALISAIRPSRMLTQLLLRANWPAMSATLRAFRWRSSSMKRACSRSVSERSLETRSRFMIAAASSSPSEA